jgi:Arc/MetJ-type ribon-helix-helix transcriptional regulator
MSKITFRADDDLIRQLEGFDASKSEVMREALREYLGESSDASGTATASSGSLDDVLAERIDELIGERLAAHTRQPQDVNVNITLDGATTGTRGEATKSDGARETRKTDAPEPANASDDAPTACKQCGEDLPPSAVYCSNCGEKASHRVFCECGDELRSDWSFCPGCGRRTPAADVLKDP